MRPKGVVGGTQGSPRKVLARFAAQVYESFVTTTLRSWDGVSEVINSLFGWVPAGNKPSSAASLEPGIAG
jgi:hypothetical protein